MQFGDRRSVRGGWTLALTALVVAVLALLLGSARADAARFETIKGYDAPGPSKYDKVGVLEVGPRNADNILVLVPGTSGGAGYMKPMASDLVKRLKKDGVARGDRWQAWIIDRRENLLEDHSAVDAFKDGEITPQQYYEYYLGYLVDPDVTDHFEAIPDDDVAFAREWGMKVAVEDIKRVVDKAAGKKDERRVVLGGHSLGGSIVTAYATWDFDGAAGADDLSGLVYIDGGSGPDPISPEDAQASLDELQTETPWLSFGGIPTPFTGLFNVVGAGLANKTPDVPPILADFPLLPSNLRPPVPTTTIASYGYALDADTSPSSLAAAQVNAGHLAATGDPRPWVRDGELSPLGRVARAFFSPNLRDIDGTAWYHPMRLTIDSRSVAAGNDNPAQDVLDVNAIHGDDLGDMPILAFGAALGGQRVLDAAQNLADQSGIPADKLTLIDRHDTYTHIDPFTAFPENDFSSALVDFLESNGG